jgi:hypothetical protein
MQNVAYFNKFLKGGTLIDAGSLLGDKEVIDEGVAIMRLLVERIPDNLQVKYNLANGLIAQSDVVPYASPAWYLGRVHTNSLNASTISAK